MESNKSKSKFRTIDEMFCSSSICEDEECLKPKNVGLITVEVYKRHTDTVLESNLYENKSKKKKFRSSNSEFTKKNLLSFEFNEDEKEEFKNKMDENNELLDKDQQTEIDLSPIIKDRFDFSQIGKDSTTDTSFLPDKKREIMELEMKKKLQKEEFEQEEKLKKQIIEVVFSYWDGRGHRRSINVPRNTTIGEFLEQCRLKLKSEFKEFSRLSSSSLMYIKEDVILPHSITFHELIKTKARGKTGPLFHFNVFDDIRTVTDIRRETTESHAGKVVKRQWYEKNKHVFPAYRWENYVPGKFNKPYSMRDD